MGLLGWFERSMERLLEGATGSVFRQKLQPAEIGKKLERAMLSQQRASVGSQLVPNSFVVRLHPRDYAEYEGFATGLCRQMEAWLARVASQRRLTVLDRISVSLVEDGSVRHRHPEIDASILDRSHPSPSAPKRAGVPVERPRRQSSHSPAPRNLVDATSTFDVAPERGVSRQQVLLRATSGAYSGQANAIAEGASTIGRSPENSVVLDAPDVSRRHARLERTGAHLRVYDLNSTNGTRVNGEAVHISDLEPGDEIQLGSQTLTVIADGDSSEREHQKWW